MTLTSYIQSNTNLPNHSIDNAILLLNEDCTIPFIARYRKEMTGQLDEVQIASILKQKEHFEVISKRKIAILKTLQELQVLTPELQNKITDSFDLNQLEDWFLPYKKKKKTKASIAKEKGLEPLAKIIMKQDKIMNLDRLVDGYLNDLVPDFDQAIEGVKHILAEWINENEYLRKRIRQTYHQQAMIISKVVKSKKDEEATQKFKPYFDFSENLSKCPAHRLLAILRGENESILKVKIQVEEANILHLMQRTLLKTNQEEVIEIIQDAIQDSFHRLLEPSISNEILQEYKRKADEVSIQLFANNLSQLLLAPPLGEKRILAIDPGYKSGCKVVCLDEKGDILFNDTIYPHAPQNLKSEAIKKIKTWINAYKIEAISIGNGTASRETEHFIQKIPFEKDLSVFVVNEAGASVYSASKIAREEFPSYDVTVRGAISIGRRLADPLAELVKIDPKSIGVGQYQHDVDQGLLQKELDQTVMLCVNQVGVNLNTTSAHLLKYVSGIGEKTAENIIQYRTENGAFDSRNALKKVPRLGDKVYQQAAAFLKVPNSKNPLDNSSVHPESYVIVEKMAKDLQISVSELMQNKALIQQIPFEKYQTDTVGLPTLKDIIKELEKPGLDPRKKNTIFQFDSSIKKIEDLKIGMKLPGIINNLTHFGCFVDIGIKESGLVHISKVCNEFITDISQKVQIQQAVQVTVIGLDVPQKRVQLSMID